MKLLITGADGFIGRNLSLVIDEHPDHTALPITRASIVSDLSDAVRAADAVIHLAGINRPEDPAEFMTGNGDYTALLCEQLMAAGRALPVIFASSIQAERDNPYGASKRAAEAHLTDYAAATGAGVAIYRLPNVFGKWSRPYYNSAVATFCHSIARGLPVEIHDPAAEIRLAYIDDVIDGWLRALPEIAPGVTFPMVEPVYQTTVGDLAAQIEAFRDVRDTLVIERVGTGLVRALYATFMSHVPPESFGYPIPAHSDPRGTFVEMLKTADSGQFSYFTAHPGVTRGGHYHHSKTEKFLVIRGTARFRFRHMLTGETVERTSEGERPEIVETIPGWTHDITNIGDDEMIVMLWANEQFDRARPDTFACPV
ncbi:capsular biosynthesis protein [Sphingomonas sp. Root710]|uniref:UDP-2-acetamido-2,6-beta-L-arabino-hexul-4-ose reductase n=1 Tax=Sphingomonas sp. Root710 TaxID=1736594 RepID=UPI0006F34C48|nr:NAD-dependent epimerase/dehydratase family protein [Sphingomonas sp. Root710]KRB85416.1 capsular biosynthesis protein [Sphingomonas sp. Root710]